MWDDSCLFVDDETDDETTQVMAPYNHYGDLEHNEYEYEYEYEGEGEGEGQPQPQAQAQTQAPHRLMGSYDYNGRGERVHILDIHDANAPSDPPSRPTTMATTTASATMAAAAAAGTTGNGLDRKPTYDFSNRLSPSHATSHATSYASSRASSRTSRPITTITPRPITTTVSTFSTEDYNHDGDRTATATSSGSADCSSACSVCEHGCHVGTATSCDEATATISASSASSVFSDAPTATTVTPTTATPTLRSYDDPSFRLLFPTPSAPPAEGRGEAGPPTVAFLADFSA